MKVLDSEKVARDGPVFQAGDILDRFYMDAMSRLIQSMMVTVIIISIPLACLYCLLFTNTDNHE